MRKDKVDGYVIMSMFLLLILTCIIGGWQKDKLLQEKQELEKQLKDCKYGKIK